MICFNKCAFKGGRLTRIAAHRWEPVHHSRGDAVPPPQVYSKRKKCNHKAGMLDSCMCRTIQRPEMLRRTFHSEVKSGTACARTGTGDCNMQRGNGVHASPTQAASPCTTATFSKVLETSRLDQSPNCLLRDVPAKQQNLPTSGQKINNAIPANTSLRRQP